jgi:DNA-binding NarL/FixJ family response regulator
VIGGKVYTERGAKEWLDQEAEKLGGAYHPDDTERFVPLSKREMEILRCVTRGMHNKAIALELGISHQTVRNHITSILTKLNVRGRTQAAVYALKHGWVRAEDYRPPAESDDE